MALDYSPFWEETLRQIREEYRENDREDEFTLWFKIEYVSSSDNKITVSVASTYIRDQMSSRGYLAKIRQKFYEISGTDVEFEVIIAQKQNKPVSSISFKSTQNQSQTTQKPLTHTNPYNTRTSYSAKPQQTYHNTYAEEAVQEQISLQQQGKKPHPELSESYTFENFISSDENAYVVNAAHAAAKNPGRAYNPLLIYGGVGLGKTHLMKAIGHYIYHNTNLNNVIYISAENFTNEFTQSIRNRTEKEFKAKYRNADVLLIDDIHFFEDKDKTQEELFHTFNALYDKNKQMVFTCDRPVSELRQITDRLKSRFQRGVNADIHMPKYEVRSAIIQHKLTIANRKLPTEIIDLIAKNIQTNIRDLEACLNSMNLYYDILGDGLTVEKGKEVISKIFSQDTSQITVENIQRVVADYYNISFSDIKSQKRNKNIVYPRHIAVYLAHELTEYSTTELGHEFGGKDHTTIMHSCQKIEEMVKTDESLENTLSILKKKIKEYRKE